MIRGTTGMLGAVLQPLAVMAGSVFHNFLTVKQGKAASAIGLPGGSKITTVGAVSALTSATFAYFGRGFWSDLISLFTAGMAGEGFNMPTVEAVKRPESTGAGVLGIGASTGGLTAGPYVPQEASWYR
jgi:hypothetical protein